MALISVTDLSVRFATRDGAIDAVDRVSFSIQRGRTLGLIGESGCGKSATALAMLRLNGRPPYTEVDGQVLFEGRDLTKLSESELSEVRGKSIGMIFQDAVASLNPTRFIEEQLGEVLRRHTNLDHRARSKRVVELLEAARIPRATSHLRKYPHELSGGLCQRVMIAIAVACAPQLLIADEPTTALDVTNQAGILSLLRDLQHELGMAVLFITHDMDVISAIADDVAVMYAGQIVEQARVEELFSHPEHPYTEALLQATPRVTEAFGYHQRLVTIPGSPPDLRAAQSGCRFAPRCRYRDRDDCSVTEPPPREIRPGHVVRTAHPRSERGDE